MAEQTSTTLTIAHFWQIIWRHKKKIVFIPLLMVALGAAFFVFFPRTYRSEARLFMRVGRESVGIDPTATTGQNVSLNQSDRKDEIKSALDVLNSRNVMAQTVDLVGPEVVLGLNLPEKPKTVVDTILKPLRTLVQTVKSLDPVSMREQAINEVEENVRVSSEKESTVIVVRYDAKTPELAQQICQAIVGVYQSEHMRIHRSEESTPFFTEQQDRLKKQLDETLEGVRNAKNELGLTSIEQRQTSLESHFNAIELERLTTLQHMATSRARSADLEQQLTKVPERLVASKKSIPNQGADLLRQQLYALQVKSMDLEARYSDSHPLVQAVNNQLKEAKGVLTEQSDERLETTDEINPIHRQLSLDFKQEESVLAGLKARLTELETQKEAVLADLRAVNQSEIKIGQLNRQAELARTKYMQYARTMEEARVDQALENSRISNISVSQPATLEEKPVFPSRLLVALGTLVAMVACTAGLVLFSEQLHIERLRAKAQAGPTLPIPPRNSLPNGDAAAIESNHVANGQHVAV